MISVTIVVSLVAPFCAIPRDYLSDNPPIARYGVFGVSAWPIACDTPPPFLSVSPLESIREVEVRYPPPHMQKGYLSDTCVIPHENKEIWVRYPLLRYALRRQARKCRKVSQTQRAQRFKAACLQNETAPEKLLNRYEKRFEKREKRSEKRSETCLKKLLAPLRPLKNISLALFNKF